MLPEFYFVYSGNTFFGERENHIDIGFTSNEKEPIKINCKYKQFG